MRLLIPKRLCCAAILSGFVLASQTPAYFPLQVGNSWSYKLAGGGAGAADRSITVDGKETMNGHVYYDVSYFGVPVLLRANPSGGVVIAFDRQSGTEKPWLSLLLPQGSTFESNIDACTKSGRVASRTAGITVPAGTFSNVVALDFQGICADAGATQQFYASHVGLVRHSETSFAGPREYDLVYYRVGSKSGSELSFTAALDAPSYAAGANMEVRLTLRSAGATPLALTFPSGQDYDVKIFDAKGDAVYTWSAGKAFPMVFREVPFGPAEKTYTITVPLGPLPPGKYKAQGYLATSPLMFLGEVSFQIVNPPQ